MTGELHPAVTPDLTRMRRELAPDAAAAFHDFGKTVFAEGALSTRTKHASEMRAGGALAHSIIAIAEMNEARLAADNDHSSHTLALGEQHGH